jgi:hypothetical protein
MDQQFLMGQSDVLERAPADTDAQTFVSPSLRARLTKAAIAEAVDFYTAFFGSSTSADGHERLGVDRLAASYAEALHGGRELGLFQKGGIREKDHLNLWCLGRVLAPTTYIESGVFIGSSLHAFVHGARPARVLAIDPNMSNLRLTPQHVPGLSLIDDQDFSQLDVHGLGVEGPRALAYFDDHINTASRILQAAEKGLRYLVFDDSTGMEGVCQRLYPAVPTLPMIVHHERWLAPGDELAWTFEHPRPLPSPPTGMKARLKYALSPPDHATPAPKQTRVTLTVTADLIELCRAAKQCVKTHARLPDLGDYIPQPHPEMGMDTSKYLVELR